VKNPQYRFDPETVGPLLVRILDEAIKEMEDFDQEFMPDVPSWGTDTPDPQDDQLEDAVA
jgi:TPP-dependent trihydroxycyclohexane-1,2-dione (THcHDO) dehydratase